MNISKLNLAIYKKVKHHGPMEFIQQYKVGWTFEKQNARYHINRLKEKLYNHLNRARKNIWPKSTHFLIKMLSKLGIIDKDLLNLLKSMFEKPTASIILTDKKPYNMKNKERIPPLSTFIPIILKVLANKERRKK